MSSKPIALSGINILELGFRRIKSKFYKENEVVKLDQLTEGLYEIFIGGR